MSARRSRAFAWRDWSNEQLLDLSMRELGVSLEGTWLEEVRDELYADLGRRGIGFRPHIWLSVDWFSPDGVPGFAVPFYLAHPRLIRLERQMLLEAEGASRDECEKIFRHECGHAIQHAYALQRRRRWQETFGRSSVPYPSTYRPNPSSRRYVQHLRLYYAQSHPDEDFAETFAVWLQPRATWRRRYAGWPAARKLEYVNELMEEIEGKPALVRSRARPDPVHRVRLTLREYYDEKRAQYETTYPDVYDRDLLRLFSNDPRHKRHELASHFLRRNRAEIRGLVSRWTEEYQFTLDQVLRDIIGRCRELRLRAVGSERRLLMDFAVLLTVKTMHFLYSSKKRIAM